MATATAAKTVTLGAYIEGHTAKYGKAKGFVLDIGKRYAKIRSDGHEFSIDLTKEVEVVWEMPQHMKPETYLPILGLQTPDQIDYLLPEWKRLEDADYGFFDRELNYRAWVIGGIDFQKQIGEIQIVGFHGTWSKKFENLPADSHWASCAIAAIDAVEATLFQIPVFADKPDSSDFDEPCLQEDAQIEEDAGCDIGAGGNFISGNSEDSDRRIPLSLIRIDGDTQARMDMDPDAIERYAYAYKNGIELPKLQVRFDGTSYWLSDGFHRVAAAKEFIKRTRETLIPDPQAADRAAILSQQGLLCHVTPGTREDAQWDALAANQTHGVPRKRSDIPKIVAMAIAHPNAINKSYTELAEWVGISPKTFKKHWDELAANGEAPEAPSVVTVTRNGKSYEMDRTNIGPKPDPSPAEPSLEFEPSEDLDSFTPVDRDLLEQNLEGEQEASTDLVPNLSEVQPEESDTEDDDDSDEQYTPESLWRPALRVFGVDKFDLDPATYAESPIPSKQKFTKDDDGLTQKWNAEKLWGNFPFSKHSQFQKKLQEALDAGTVKEAIVLTKCDCRPGWFQNFTTNSTAYCLVRGGVKFERSKHLKQNVSSSRFGVVIFYYGSNPAAFQREYGHLGAICQSLPDGFFED